MASLARKFCSYFNFFSLSQHMKRSALQNKRVGVLRMAFWARKVPGLSRNGLLRSRASKMKISRLTIRAYVKKPHQKACRTCSTIISLHSTCQINDLWRCRGRCHRHFFNNNGKFFDDGNVNDNATN